MRSQKAGFREFMAGLERPHKLDHVDPNKGPSTG